MGSVACSARACSRSFAWVAVVVCVPVLLVGCGAGGNSASSVARIYEQAILSRDGGRLCSTFAPKMREVISEQFTLEQKASGAANTRFDCGAYYHVLIGYSHENVDKQFVSGRLLGIGRARAVRSNGVLYARVPAKLKFEFVYTGYSTTHRSGERGATVFADTVWLARDANGAWRVVKPSIGLFAASAPSVLDEPNEIAHVNAPPPDPDYSMNPAERTRAETADYRASFRRRTIGHSPLACKGKRTSVRDPIHDAVTYPTGSALRPVAVPAGNDIRRVSVQAAGHTICVTVTFRKKPTGRLSIAFTPRWPHAFFGAYIMEINPSLGVRGGGLTTSYRYFRGGYHLNSNLVKEISLYRTTVAFTADAAIGRPLPAPFSADNLGALYWQVRTGARTGVDEVPNERHGEYLLVRQSDGHVVAPPSG